MNNWTLRAKLIALLTAAVAALVLVGAVGWIGLENTGVSLSEVGKNRMPSVLGLEIINEAQTAARSNNRKVSQSENDYKAQATFAQILKDRDEIWKRVEEGFKIYEPLPQTAEEAEIWKQFVKDWDEWKDSDVKISKIIAALANNTDEQKQKALFAGMGKINGKFVIILNIQHVLSMDDMEALVSMGSSSAAPPTDVVQAG